MSGPSERDEIAAVLGEHSWDMTDEVKVNGVWTLVLCCECGDQPRLTEGHQHIADAILASDWLAERDRRTAATAVRAMGARFRNEGRETWGADVGWTTTGSKVAGLAASWCDEEADRIERGE